MRYCENELTYADYILLRSSVGWNNVEGDQMAQAV